LISAQSLAEMLFSVIFIRLRFELHYSNKVDEAATRRSAKKSVSWLTMGRQALESALYFEPDYMK